MASALVIAISSCTASSSEDEPALPSGGAIKLSRLDLSGAKYLTLGESSDGRSRANTDNVLFKVDENGNVSAVVLECIEEEDGTSTTVRKDISIHPHEISNLTASWMYLWDCSFDCDDVEAVGRLRSSYDTAGSFYFNILVNKKTGKLFYIPDAYGEYFTVNGNHDSDYTHFLDGPGGELYTQTHPVHGLSKVTVSSNGEAKIEKIGPNDISFSGGSFHVLGNGTIVLINGDAWGTNGLTLVYPNNGFEYVSDSDYEHRLWNRKTWFYYFNGNIIAGTLIDEYDENFDNVKQTLQLRNFSVDTGFGSHNFSAPIFEIKQELTKSWGQHGYDFPEEDLWGNHINRIAGYYENDKYRFIGQTFAIHKTSGEVVRLSGRGSQIVFPDSNNVYQGKAWYTYADAADWFDCETLESGRVYYDTSILSNYYQKDQQANIPDGEYMITAISQIDGKKVIVIIDITTGRVKKIVEVVSTSESITLIPMN